MSSDADVIQVLDRLTDRFYGKYRGTVAQNVDPENMGRITANVPEVLGDTPTSWAMPSAPFTGDGCGSFMIPDTGAGVWIEFEAGDVSRPIWTGAWWGANTVPLDHTGAQVTYTNKIVRTENGLIVSLNDTANTISLADAQGQNIVTIKVSEGTILVQSATKVVVEAPLIQHGASAQHPHVHGDELLTYLNQLVTLFNAHMHPGELAAGVIPVTPAPPVAPFTPPSPSMLSTKAMTE